MQNYLFAYYDVKYILFLQTHFFSKLYMYIIISTYSNKLVNNKVGNFSYTFFSFFEKIKNEISMFRNFTKMKETFKNHTIYGWNVQQCPGLLTCYQMQTNVSPLWNFVVWSIGALILTQKWQVIKSVIWLQWQFGKPSLSSSRQ